MVGLEESSMLFGQSARVARRIARIVAAAGLIAAIIPATAWAAGGGATIARGIQHEFGSCGSDDGYLMTGSLEGCWWVDTFEVKPMPVHGTMLAHGVEHFEGCLGTVCGTFATTYTYTARFDGATELHGRCHHPITGGTGGFAGARGELEFTDVVSAEPFFYPYWGNIQLNRTALATNSSIATTTSSSLRTSAASRAVAVAPC
jgi:hypothetical protein